jgi:tRNA threonylcarbamoyladenosine biosynthesis protein TsaB
MRLLAIDTTGPGCAVALRIPGQADRLVREAMTRGQAERLAPMVEELLADAGMAPRELDRIGVCTGPGSFAGSRIGVAFARGLALATDADCVGISRLAWTVKDADVEGDVLAVHDARRGDVVIQRFRDNLPISPPETLTFDALRERLLAPPDPHPPWEAFVMVGNGAQMVFPKTENAQVETREPGLRALLDLVANADPDASPPKPFYARPPDAKLPGGETP